MFNTIMDYNRENKFENQTITHECYTSFPSWVQNLPTLPFFHLQIQMVFIFFITQLLHHLILKRIGMPPLVSQMLAGIAIGPAGLGRYQGFQDFLFPRDSFTVTKCITMLSFALSEFFIASQIDFTIIKRTRKRTMIIGLVSLIFGFIGSYLASTLVRGDVHEKHMKDIKIVIAILAGASHPSLVCFLTDMGLANSELGRLTLGTSLCMEVFTTTLRIFTPIIVPDSNEKALLLEDCIKILGLLALYFILIFILRPFLRLLIKATPNDRPIKETYVLLTFLATLGGGLYTYYFGQSVTLGFLLIGCALPNGPPLGSALVVKFGSLFFGILFPFFISLTTAQTDFALIDFHDQLVYSIGLVIIVTMATKVIIFFTYGIYSNMTHQDALSFALLMCFKGFMEIGYILIITELEIISRECFTVISIYTILMSILLPPIVKLLYDPMRKYGGFQIRDIMHLKQNVNLRMVTCVLRSDNIFSISNLLRIMNPTREAPIEAHILHLMKLEGRCHPLFISHDIQKKCSYRSYSNELIWNFDRMKNFRNGALSTHVYTVVTQHDAMHEYICTIALDHVVSIIILPFHRKFGVEGSIVFYDHEQKILNTSVLERPPCSIAVLVDRSHVNLKRHDASLINVVATTTEVLLSVAVIFIGCNDDREALAFAQRMRRGMKIRLTVIRLAAPNDEEQFLNSLDSKAIDMLLDKRFGEDTQQIMYIQVAVKDGIETALKLRSMVQDYNLIIVGRRLGLDCPQTSGLSESSEIKELGVLGDLLASPDLKCRASVLVVQQQKHWT